MSDDRQKRLDKAHRQLSTLPELLAEDFTAAASDRVNTARSKATGSPALIRLDLMALFDTRHKHGFDGTDPRYVDLGQWLGILPELESWTRVLWEEHPHYCSECGGTCNQVELADQPTISSETSTLLRYWPWITEQQWATELADDIGEMTARIRQALGRPQLRLQCQTCKGRAWVQNEFLICESGHEESVRNLSQRQRRRPALSTREICEEFGIDKATLWKWRERGKIEPINPDTKPHLWMPWDVMRIQQPDLVEAVESQDTVSA